MERDPAGTATVESPDSAGEDPHLAEEDVLVLPWWQNPVNIAVMVVTAALLAGLVAWSLGRASAEPEGNDVDVGFLHDMRVHHEQAVAMGFMFLDRPDTAPGLRVVARSIVFGQGIDIGRMIQQLRDLEAPEAAPSNESMAWMGMAVPSSAMPGLATDEQLDELGAATGAAADDLFVELMVTHHEGGIHMAEYAAEHAASTEVRAMADSIVHSQQDEIGELQRLVGG